MKKVLLLAFASVALVCCNPCGKQTSARSETREDTLKIGKLENVSASLSSYEELSAYVSGLDGFVANDSLGSDRYKVLREVLDDFNVPVAPACELEGQAKLFRRAKALMDSIIVLDTHCDFAEVAYYHPQKGYAVDEPQSRLQFSIEKMNQGHASAQYLALWLRPDGPQDNAANVAKAPEELWRILDFLENHVADRAGLCGIARNRDEVLALKAQGKKAFLIGLENAFFAGDDLGVVKKLADRGITYITLSHYGDNQVCHSSNRSDNPTGGLTEYGKDFIREMNRQGIVIDLSHTSYQTWQDVLELSEAPVVFTHSGAEAVWKNPRNVDDATLEKLASKGGVIQIYLVQDFMGPGQGENVGIKEMVEHIDHCVKLIGIDHVGVGMDLDGGGGGIGFNGVNDAINLTMELLKLGYSNSDIAKIWGENYLRVLTEVQAKAYAASGAKEYCYSPAGENIKTRWAAEVSPQNAHTEYPRPQMVREDWVNLNGLWDYAVCSEKNRLMPLAQGKILVPFCIESSLSGVGRRVSAHEALWYRRTVEVPLAWKDKKVLLHFDAVDNSAAVFINREPIGVHTGGYTSFSYDISRYAGQTVELSVKVCDPTDGKDACVPHGKQVSKPGGIWYTPVTGIWQTVWMEAVGRSYIKDYNVTASTDGTVKVDVDVEGDAHQVRVKLFRPGLDCDPEELTRGLICKAKAEVEPGRTAVLKVRRPKLWTPDHPYLYGLRIELLDDGTVIDKVDAYTAIRTVGIKRDENGVKRLALNGDILFQFGPLDQGWWPDGLYTAPTAEALAWDIEQTKSLGFNMIRKHIKVEPARWYYDCDRLGIMVWQDMPSIAEYNDRNDWGQGNDYYGSGRDYTATPGQKANYYKEWGEIIGQLKKHPCIVSWIPFNEAWGQFDTKQAVEFTRQQDSTRLINAASGGNWIKGAGDILDSHSYPNPRMRILDSAMVNVLGEYGGIGRPIEGHTWDIGHKWGYVQYDTEQKVTDTYCLYAQDLLDIKQTAMCAAAIYTQTTDVEGEVNGFFTYDREILKVNRDRVREANRKVIEAPCTPPLTLASPAAFHYKDPDAGVPYQLQLFTLRNGGLTMQVTDFGARIISLFTPDRNGVAEDIIVGYNDARRYVHNAGERFFGAAVGRVANRIAGGRFSLDGKTYTLPRNNNGQTLHGGLTGIDMAVWQVKARTDSSITLCYTVPDGQDGFPGNLKIELCYTLTSGNTLDMNYKATTDKATPVNLSNHAFYNLCGPKGSSILGHFMQIDADGITPVDENLIPTGEIMDVTGTPFDFREPHTIGERIDAQHPQLAAGNGYDHNWTLNAPMDGTLQKVCTVSEPQSGRVMEILTDQPGLQFYSGNFFDGSYDGKVSGQPIEYRSAIALEPQKWPDAINQPSFPNTVLRPGETYTQHSVYRFTVSE